MLLCMFMYVVLGGTLRVYGSILRPDVSYVTLLLSVNDSAATVLRETLDKYGMSYQDPQQFCIVQVMYYWSTTLPYLIFLFNIG